MFERFTDRARRVMKLAQDEAKQLDHNYIGTEHLLLGLLAEADGVGGVALNRLSVELDAAREYVKARLDPPSPSMPRASPPFTPRAKKVLELSLREALQLGHNYIGTEHILLGLVREGDGVAAHVLVDDYKLDLSRVRQQVIQVLSDYSKTASDAVPPSIEANLLLELTELARRAAQYGISREMLAKTLGFHMDTEQAKLALERRKAALQFAMSTEITCPTEPSEIVKRAKQFDQFLQGG